MEKGMLLMPMVMAVILVGCLMSSAEIPIKIKVSAPFPLESKLEARLEAVSKDLIAENFPEEYAKSGEVRGDCEVLEKVEDAYICEVIITFLYKETDTAVLSRLEFEYIPEEIRVREVEPEYVPEMKGEIPSPVEENLALKREKESSIGFAVADVPQHPADFEAIIEEAGGLEKIIQKAKEVEEKAKKESQP